MTEKEIPMMRLRSQQIVDSRFSRPAQAVSWMGAMQSQDLWMSEWAVSLRSPGSSQAAVRRALDAGKILRTHLLRPTWHLVAARDIRWMLELTAPQVRARMRSRDKQLGLDNAIYKKSNRIIEKSFREGKPLQRDALLKQLQAGKIAINENRAAHLLMEAELSGLIASGPFEDGKLTYAWLDKMVPKPDPVPKDQALSMLALRYFSSRGPATLADFCWWSGLPVTKSKTAVDIVGRKLSSAAIGAEKYWYDPAFEGHSRKKNIVALLPAYDEYIIAYRDRKNILAETHRKKMISSNGIFWPSIVIDGQVRGIWKRAIVKDRLQVVPDIFDGHHARLDNGVRKCISQMSSFLGMKPARGL